MTDDEARSFGNAHIAGQGAVGIDPSKIGKERKRYASLVKNRRMNEGVTATESFTDPYDLVDGKYQLNSWTHSRNMDPSRGTTSIRNPLTDEVEQVPYAERKLYRNAYAGMLGYDYISQQLEDLQAEFRKQLNESADKAYDQLD